MTYQIIMAVWLGAQAILALAAWLRTRSAARSVVNILPHWMRLFINHGWLTTTLPLGEASVLWAAGFWG